MNIASFPDRTLLVIAGPTAVGKTGYAAALAETNGLPVISADSRQFYKEMRIGTARPPDEVLKRVPHHFVGMLSIRDYYNAFMYEQAVLELLDRLFAVHRVVLMAGGSPLYIDAVCRGMDLMPDPDPEIRQQVNALCDNGGVAAVRERLRPLDPAYCEAADPNDRKRLMRALEVCLQTGRPYSQFLHGARTARGFHVAKFYLNRPRPVLFDRINRRVDGMMDEGLLNEVKGLYPYKGLNALNTVGYKELFDCLDGKCSLEQAVADIKTHTRRYAKRQLTWFKRDYREIMLQDE